MNANAEAEEKDEMEETEHYTRKEERIMRLIEKMRDAKTERRKLHLAKRIRNIADDKNDLDQKTKNAMAKAGIDTILAHEAKNQTWYYNDMIEGITKRDGRVRYDGNYMIIDTYNPLFSSPINLPGSVRVACSPEDLQRQGVTPDVITQYQHPEFYDKKGEMKGLFDVGTDALQKAGMTPKAAEGWKGVLQVASYVGIGVGLWHYGKKVFGVFSKDKDKRISGWKWLAG